MGENLKNQILLALKYIKFFSLIIIVIGCFGCNRKTSSSISSTKNNQLANSEFVHYFSILDSAAAEVKSDTIVHCCIGPIAFMETSTKIPASSHGGFTGKMYFTKNDLKRWHEWYDIRYGKKN